MTSTKRDYYEILNISKTAELDEIKSAYRKLAIQFHPDRNPDDPASEESFKEATEAYKVLSDTDQRQIYDTYGHQGLEGSGFQGYSSMDEIFDSFDVFGSVLGDLFGFGGRRGGGGRQRVRKGRSIRVRVPLSFEEAYSGTDKKLALNDNVACTECKGSGAAQDGLSTCGHCNGSGQVVTRSGFFAMQTTCSRCGGRGSTITARCDACKGVGAIEEHRTVPVTIPAGVGSGDSMGVPSEGEMGPNGGPRGDLILVFDVAKHERFERDGIELHTEIPISFFQAALGDKIKLETVDSEESLKIEPGSQPGDIVRLRRKGMPDPNSGRRGDLHCHLQVSVPKRLSRKQRKALEGIRSILETEE